MTQAIKEGKLKRGDLLCLAAFGSGFTWGAALIEY
jgi:3-oxoacyl-[acyl-carrier-protein] synthase-3